jgi:hypothetical protein
MDELDRFLEVQTPGPDLEQYTRAAAVLWAFDPFKLNPVDGDKDSVTRDDVLSSLLPLCESVSNAAAEGLWTLLLPHRREALKALATRQEMKKALDANPDRPQTIFQIMFEQLLAREDQNLDQLSRDELAATLEVLEWVEDILDGLPEETAVRSALARSDLLSPMERLAGEVFVGREEELVQLHEYVFGVGKSAAPLFVFGTGGVGKSTLLARFMLNDALTHDVAFAYVDIDRSIIRPDQPLTVLLDFIVQLYPQLGVAPEIADSIVKEITHAIARYEGGRYFESAGAYIPIELIEFCARNVKQWLNGRTALLIVDTMEEAQFLGGDVMWPLVEFISVLDHSLEELRTILVGRALPAEYMNRFFNYLGVNTWSKDIEGPEILNSIPLPGRPLNLTELAPEEARRLLRFALPPDTGGTLSDEDLNDVIGLVGRNPMVLKLAARLLQDEGLEKLRSERSELFARLKAEKVQALLYGRILRHVHDDEVRKVAYPGLIVRRITPEVIRDVLAEPCKLELRQDYDVYNIFYRLAREKALIFMDTTDNSLHHRPDVRRSMLEDLNDHIEPAVIKDIDSRAVEFYSKQTGAVARAEEIYHRLRLGEDESILNERWLQDAAPLLQGALNEVAAEQRLWLAEHLNVTLDDATREAASQEAWEKQAARSADRYLNARLPEDALQVLHERATRLPRSNLYALETEAYRFLKKYDEALDIARKGVESASKAGAIDMAIELLLKMVVIEEGRGNLSSAEEFLKEADAVSAHSSDQILRLRVLITHVRLQRQLRPAERKERAALKKEASAILSDSTLRQLRDHPVLLREVAAELSKQDSRIAAAALETLGVEVATDAQAEAFGRAVANVTNIDTPEMVRGSVTEKGVDLDEIRKWAKEGLTSREARKLSRSVAASAAGSTTLRDFREYFRAGVSSALKGQDLD